MDYYSLAAYLVVVLAASHAANSFPVHPLYESPKTDWDKLAPQINVSLVDFCFFNQSGWKIAKSSSDTPFLCNLVTSNKTLPKEIPHKLFDPVRAIYADYVKNLKNDQQTVFECFIHLPNLTDLSKSDCWKVTKPSLANDNTSRAMTLRESNAQMYQGHFASFVPKMNSTFVDYCYYKKTFLQERVHRRSNVYRFCNLISIRQKAFPDPLLISMQDLYADYEDNERNDRQTVFDCYLKHHLTMEDDDCWKVVNRTDYEQNPILKREVYSRAYLDAFDNFYEEMDVKLVDYCWYNETLWKTLHPKANWAQLHFCQLITSKVNHTDEKIASLQKVFQANYGSKLAVNDELKVLKCFFASITSYQARSACWKVLAQLDRFDSITSSDLAIRETKAKAYLGWLEDRMSEMNIAYVEHCYYDYLPLPWDKRQSKVDKIFCELIVNKAFAVSHPLDALRELLDDYTTNEKTDHERVWKCFVEEKYRCHGFKGTNGIRLARCQECFEKYLTSGTYTLSALEHTRRYANAKSYNEKIIDIMEHHTYFANEHYQVFETKHCALFHRRNDWDQCPQVNLYEAPSDDEMSIGFALAKLDHFPSNVTQLFDRAQIIRALLSLEKAKKLELSADDLKPILDGCVNGVQSNQCENVFNPMSGVNYSLEDKELQKVWNHAEELMLKDDCQQFHNRAEDHWDKCDGIVGLYITE